VARAIEIGYKEIPMSVLYQDKTVTLTNDYILIPKYYFPLATSKTILYS
jgi:hypothetical protein